MPDCPNCGKHVSDEAPYCLSCGAAQQPERGALQQSSPEAQQPVPSQAPEPPQPTLAPPDAPAAAQPSPGRYAAPAGYGPVVQPPPAAGATPAPYAAQPVGPAGATPAPQGQGLPGWAIALIVAAVLLGTGLPVAIVIFSFVTVGNVVEEVAPMIEDQIRLVDERALRDGVTSIQGGVEAWAADHGGKYPAAGMVDRIHLVSPEGLSYVDPWPQNPYAGGAMTQGTGEGQFLYVRGPEGGSYSLTGYGTGGSLLIALP